MQQQSLTSLWRSIVVRFRSKGGEFRRDPQGAWKIALSFLGLGVVASLGVGYLMYVQAVQVDSGADATIVPRSPLRSVDVASVIDTYKQKKERLNALLLDRPRFLSPEKGESTPAPKEEIATPGTSTPKDLPL
jgi:hypothetical protein